MKNLLTKIIGDPNLREIKRARILVEQINRLAPEVKKTKDLKKETEQLKEALASGKSLNEILPQAFALAREAAERTIQKRHYDVQLIGGIVMHEGKIAEMKTGEGKTLVATLPAYLNALTGKGVHVVTVNDYLARRDTGWMGRVYHELGLTTGCIIHNESFIYDPDYKDESHDDERLQHLRPITRQEAYAADITYGTNNEFGFDYLRDNMVDDVKRLVQRELHYAIVDEVDSILIDEARTPLIISAPAEESTDKYYKFAQLASRLKPDEHFTVDEKLKAVSLTDEGIAALEKALGVENVYEAGNVEDVHHIEQALKARALFRLDRDYVVREGEVIIVDEFTGRLMPGRRWSEGLHQAIEAKENLTINKESLTLATITFQNYFRLYKKLAGMTGTAATEAEEFGKIYHLDVVEIPTHHPMVREDRPDRVYKTEMGKFKAVAREVKECHDRGQPVLLGTVSIEKNELLSAILTQFGIPHEVLNAKNNEAEAAIIARAGGKKAVTLATNIAGRGTDIVLGEGVAELGGLHVIGTERHESRRIDNQLRGRAGRQGDPGSTQFFVSLEDDLMRIFGSERIANLMTTLGLDEDTPIENKIVSRSIESAQKKVEGHYFDSRKHTVEYDDVLNRHRQVIYAKRRRALENDDLRPEIVDMIRRELEAVVTAHTDARTGILEYEKVWEAVAAMMPTNEDLKKKLQDVHPEDLVEKLMEHANDVYDWRVKEFGEEGMKLVERWTYLRVLDSRWIEHLEAMESLREGIGLRAIGQRDPLVEYKSEGFRLFKQLIATMEGEIASSIFKAVIHRHDHEDDAVETALTKAAAEAATNAPEETQAPRRPVAKAKGEIGRNDPCPCGSGKKYKRCGMINAPEHRG
jgi:preprotein translocase subunit SecA